MKPANQHRLKILVAPLDWGLGHTTRCIPIIDELIKNGADVLLAGNETQERVLKEAFPQCTFLPLKGYEMVYSKKKRGLFLKLLSQAPKAVRLIKEENKWLKKTIIAHQVDGVISDNRFGLHSTQVPCIFITHQLLIKTSAGIFAEKIIQRINYSKINKFYKCWIPDFKGAVNLAGDLSHPLKKPAIHCEYIGSLSRMKDLKIQKATNHLLIIISGPEPQRSIFEKLIFDQLQNFHGTATVVRGLPVSKSINSNMRGVTIYNHLDKDKLNREMCKAEFVICRSGYSSVMDIYAAGAKSIMIPTPGQTEQEYLAHYLSEKQFCITAAQQSFDLAQLVETARQYCFSEKAGITTNRLEIVVKSFLKGCEKAS